MKTITKAQIRAIHGLGRSLGIDDGTKDCPIYDLAETMCGYRSLAALTEEQAKMIIDDLKRKGGALHTSGEKKKKESPKKEVAGMSEGQIHKVWFLMYELAKYDREPAAITLGQRLCGVIKKELGIDASEKAPFRWLTYQQGSKLIEALKRYVSSAARKAGCAHGG